MSEPRLDTKTKQAIIRDYRSGMPIKDIAEKYGVHQSYPGMLSRRYRERDAAMTVALVSLGAVEEA